MRYQEWEENGTTYRKCTCTLFERLIVLFLGKICCGFSEEDR